MTIQKSASPSGEPSRDTAPDAGVQEITDWAGGYVSRHPRQKPSFHLLAAQNKDVVFIELDKDQNADSIQDFGIWQFPTFVFIIGGSIVTQFAGCDHMKLMQTVKQYKKIAAKTSEGLVF